MLYLAALFFSIGIAAGVLAFWQDRKERKGQVEEKLRTHSPSRGYLGLVRTAPRSSVLPLSSTRRGPISG